MPSVPAVVKRHPVTAYYILIFAISLGFPRFRPGSFGAERRRLSQGLARGPAA